MIHSYSNKNSKKNEIPIYAGKRIVGKVRGDTFHKAVNGSKHFLKIPPAIAFDVSTLEDAERVGAVCVQIKDRDTGKVYKASIKHIWERGMKFNRGWGEQIALTLEGWTKTQKGGGTQPPLFGGE